MRSVDLSCVVWCGVVWCGVADRVSCGCEAGREDAVPTGADAGTWFDFGERAAGR